MERQIGIGCSVVNYLPLTGYSVVIYLGISE